ncbi:MAG: single-stranded DNA-binding protein [Oligoflexales bacterium]|nr:single-stranded DNA-binding protein [Oligoflexales bacterium]
MSSVNKVLILGRLGQDPEVRYTPNQVPVVTLNIATSESWNKDGQKQEQTEWHRVVVWSRQAENCAKYLSKGRMVFVEGRLQTRQWEDKTGQKRYTTEIIANNVQFINSSTGQGAPQGQYNEQSSGPSQQSGYDNFQGSDSSAGSSSARYSGSFPPSSTSSSSNHDLGDLSDIPF